MNYNYVWLGKIVTTRSEQNSGSKANIFVEIETDLIPLNCVRFEETAGEVQEGTVSYADQATQVGVHHHKSDKTD